jgi:hypothetical protein
LARAVVQLVLDGQQVLWGVSNDQNLWMGLGEVS